LSLLESKVPPYMIPGYLDILPEFPRTISGKVDRNRLSQPVTPLIRVSETVVHPQTEREHIITEVWSSVLGVHVASVADDFFLDLGGHSLVAAQMVTKLRERVGQSVSVRDAYEFPTVQRLAAHLDALVGDTEFTGDSAETTSVGSSREVFDATPRSHRWGTVGTQALSMYALSAPVMIPTAVVFLLALGWIQGAVSTGRLLLLAFVVIPIMSWPILLVVSIAAKWILIGRYKPGEHKLWSGYYLRWWLANRIAALSGAFILVGTPLLPIYFRLMGARVGPRCTLNTAQCSAWDLVAIGADSSIGADTQILGYRVEGGMLRLGGVEIGNRCFVGIHSALGLDVRMSDGSSLDDQSLLPDGDVIPAGQGRQGSPSRNTVVNLPAECPDARQSSVRRAVFALVHVLATDVMAILMLVPGVAFLLAYWFAFTRGGLVVGILTMAASVPVGVIVYCLYIAGLKRALLHGIRPGTYSVLSCAYLRKWTSDGLMGMTRALLLPVYTTLYLPPFLRLLGARIGPRAEISTVWSFSPELIDVGPESFFADGAIIGGRRTHLGVFQIEVNRVGRRSFVGNGAVVPVGQSLGDGCLLGVQSIPPAGRPVMPDGTEWLGSPSFALTHRVKVKTFGETTTFRPTRGLYAQRAVIDGLRILIPAYLGLLTVTAAMLTLFVLYRVFGVAVAVAVAPVVGFVLAVAAATFVAGLKKCVMGTYRSEIKPLWCRYVWLNEMVNGAYESVFVPAVSSMLGTPFIVPFLRMLGCHIGRRAYIATTLFSEFDLVEVGDYVALNHGVVVQNHLFEDRVFKSSALKIADEASIGNLSVVLYDSEVRRGAIIGPLSLVMKGETIEERTRWHGIPISQTNDQATLKRTSVIARSDVKVR
jgi:non-ribosomal peptide synthetase-like protein